MSANEKIYLEEGDVIVSESRVKLGDKNFVLRNIASTQVFSQKLKVFGIVFCVIICVIGILLGAALGSFAPSTVFIIMGLLFLLFKDKHYVQIDSGGTPTNTIFSDTIDFPQKVVEAINTALIDLDNKGGQTNVVETNSKSEKSAAEQVKEMKELLDSGAITQDEFDAKKKELLNL